MGYGKTKSPPHPLHVQNLLFALCWQNFVFMVIYITKLLKYFHFNASEEGILPELLSEKFCGPAPQALFGVAGWVVWTVLSSGNS
jgi:hypothetical protein